MADAFAFTRPAGLEPHVAFCGLDCADCAVYVATKTGDDNLRQAYAGHESARWKIQIEPARLNCHGCRDLQPKTGFCATCQVRACALERGLEDCARCGEYPCAKLDRVHAAMVNVGKAVDGVAKARINLDRLRRERGLA
jgi:hypothetical protein